MAASEKILSKSSWNLWIFKYYHDNQGDNGSQSVGPEQSDEDVLVGEITWIVAHSQDVQGDHESCTNG